MSLENIVYYNRYSEQLEVEKIYGERSVRWAYETSTGKLALSTYLTRPWLSALHGMLMNRTRSRNKILPFIHEYDLDIEEFRKAPDTFRHFNDFFYRELKPRARPIDKKQESIVFPADGRHFLIPNLDEQANFFLKGNRFNTLSLLGDSRLAEVYRGGSLVISRLCPVDYHRYHFPISGDYQKLHALPGPLHSVNPIALFLRPHSLWTNRRCVSTIRRHELTVGFVEIGATLVGAIHDSAKEGAVLKGEEKGYFSFGGSCIITLFPASCIEYAEDLKTQSARGIELYAKMGDTLGMIAPRR